MLDTLRGVIDASAISRDTDAFAMHDVTPGAVIEPRSAEEAAAIMKLAVEKQWRVECVGAGTQAYGNRRTRADIVISTRALTKVVEYEAADLVIGVQAGMTLHKLERATRRNSQFLALDPATHEHSTIGGVIAAGRSGPLRYAHGTPRDHVLGLQVVTGDGRILDLGGRVVKNVAGYDLVRLMVGSAGTLGLITSAYLRLKPVPQVDESLTVTAPDVDLLIDLMQQIVHENLEAGAIELLGPNDAGEPWTLVVRLSGSPDAVADATARINALSSGLPAAMKPVTDEVWQAMQLAELNAHTTIRLADLPARLSSTLQLAQKVVARAVAPAQLIAHAADGIVRLYLGAANAENVAFAIGEARSVMSVSGGSVVVHSREAELMRRADAFGAVGATQPLMARLKHIFDPAGILAPGRFVA